MSNEERAVDVAVVDGCLVHMNDLLQEAFRPLRKPIIGGLFGVGGFVLCSDCIVSGGLHRVTYFVALADPYFVLSFADSKPAALATARAMVSTLGAQHLSSLAANYAGAKAAQAAIDRAASIEQPTQGRARSKAVARVSRKRRRLFEQYGGKCFYCACELDLLGSWHIDHRMPRAMGGDNSIGNLALACAKCNLSKGDKTDVEFMAAIKGAA